MAFIRWTEEQYLIVARELIALRNRKIGLSPRQEVEEAQKALPIEFQRQEDKNYLRVWHKLKDIISEIKESQHPEPTSFTIPSRQYEPACTPVAPSVPKQEPVGPQVQQPVSPVLGPLELALQSMVERAVSSALENVVKRIETVLESNLERQQALLVELHDSLRGHWDDDYKRSHLIAGEPILHNIGNLTKVLEQPRVRRQRVLIVTSNQKSIRQHVESNFSGIDFEYHDGQAVKQLSAGGFYDAILCNGTVAHSVFERLRQLHGIKVKTISGGHFQMTEALRKQLSI